MVTGYEAEFYENIKQMRKDFTEIRKDMGHICQYLNENGYSNIYNLNGGITSWALEIDSDMATY